MILRQNGSGHSAEVGLKTVVGIAASAGVGFE